jgi:plasmid maintenance system antidote protein VapI
MAKKQKESNIEVGLLQNLLAIEFWRGGLSQEEIAKRLGVAKASVNEILKGVNREILIRGNNKE